MALRFRPVRQPSALRLAALAMTVLASSFIGRGRTPTQTFRRSRKRRADVALIVNICCRFTRICIAWIESRFRTSSRDSASFSSCVI